MHFENALPQTCRGMGVESRVGTLVIGVDGALRRAIGLASYQRKPGVFLGGKRHCSKANRSDCCPIPSRGLLNGYARTAWFQALAAAATRGISVICGRFPRVGPRHPRCLSTGRGSGDRERSRASRGAGDA